MISDGSVSLGQNTDAAKSKATVATVGGEPFYDWDLAAVQGQLPPLRNQRVRRQDNVRLPGPD